MALNTSDCACRNYPNCIRPAGDGKPIPYWLYKLHGELPCLLPRL